MISYRSPFGTVHWTTFFVHSVIWEMQKKLLLLQFFLFFPTVWKWLDLVSRPCDGPWCAANFMRDEDFWDIVIAMSCPALHAFQGCQVSIPADL